MICKKCGNILNEGEAFCNNCGTAVNAEEVTTSQVETQAPVVEEPNDDTFMDTQPFTIDEVARRVEENKESEVSQSVESTPEVEPAPAAETPVVETTQTPVEPIQPVTEPVQNVAPTPSKKGKVAGIIIGIVVGGLVLLIAAIIIIVLALRSSFNKAINTATKTGTSTTTNTTTEKKKTVDNDTVSPYKTRKSKTNPVVKIDLTGMTGEEIVENCLDAVEISNGDKAYDYTDRFKYESPNYILLNKEHKVGLAGNWSWKDFSKDAFISHVAFHSIQEKDNGTLVINKNPIVQITLEFKTYEVARDTFDEFSKEYSKIGTTTSKQTEGERESVHVMYEDYDYYVSLVYPDKEGRTYKMFAWIPVAYYMQEK